MTNLIQLKSII